jgi:hypothetical protein
MSGVEATIRLPDGQDLTVEVKTGCHRPAIQEYTGSPSERVLHPHKNLRSSQCIAGHKKSFEPLAIRLGIKQGGSHASARHCLGGTLGMSVDTHAQG